jgi:hypothetical protein
VKKYFIHGGKTIMRLSSLMTHSGGSVGGLNLQNAKITGFNKNTNDKNSTDNGGNDNNSTIKAPGTSIKTVIEKIKERLNDLDKVSGLTEDEKESMRKTLTKQIETLEQMEKKQKSETLKKTLNGLNGDDNKVSDKTRERQQQFNRANKPKNGVVLSISEAAFKGLVTAEMELDRAQEANALKVKKEAEAVRNANEMENDRVQGASIEGAERTADSADIADDIGNETVNQFAIDHAKAQSQVDEAYDTIAKAHQMASDGLIDQKTADNMMADPLAYLESYERALNEYVTGEVDNVLNSEEFKGQYGVELSAKEKLADELESAIGNLESSHGESLKKANEVIENDEYGENKEDENTPSEESTDNVKGSDTVTDVINRAVEKHMESYE